MATREATCDWCGGKFLRHPQRPLQRFCSKSCANRRYDHRGQCAYCGKDFYKKNRNQRCCSLSCAWLNRNGTQEERFWSRVDRNGPAVWEGHGPCWVWTRPLDSNGYSHGIGRERGHVFSYRLTYGPIPEGMEIDHLCRNHACVRPDHLEAVPPRINNLRGMSVAAINARKTHCIHGHPFNERNTYIRKDGGARQCRQCALDRYHARKARRKEHQ
jgi:hypothetical protein